MDKNLNHSRRRFFGHASALAATVCLADSAWSDPQERPRESPLPKGLAGPANEDTQSGSNAWLQKTVKANMLKPKGTDKNGDWTKKLEAALQAGFTGVEPTTWKLDTTAFSKAAEETGIEVDGTVGGYHWKIRHTDPDPDVRKQAFELLELSLNQTAELGGKTFLIVPGHGKDGSDEDVYRFASDAITRALPLAEKLGVQILIENVWNHFLYDHEGDENQSVQPLADFVDSFGSDLVGLQFDLGNHHKYGDVAQWVRTLGSRIKKLDIKGFSRTAGKFTDITEGDVNWEAVRHALADIGFQGWLAAEVGGGDLARLTKVAGQMENALHCDSTIDEIKQEVHG